jgi:hypothetical protein
MSDTIGKDGLTDEERIEWARAKAGALDPVMLSDRVSWLSSSLAAERLAHAETRAGLERQLIAITDRLFNETATLTARAEKAEAERDRLRAALEDIAGRLDADGGHLWARAQSEPCTCVMHVAARALLGEVKP